MSSTHSLLEQLSALDIHISLVDGQLHVDAPKGSLTPELKHRLHSEHHALTEHLRVQHSAPDSADTFVPTQALHPDQLGQLSNHHTRPAHEPACMSLHVGAHIDSERLLNAWTHVLNAHDLLNRSWIVTSSGIRSNQGSTSAPKPYFFVNQMNEQDVIHTNYGDINAYVYNLHIQDCQTPFTVSDDHLIRLNLNLVNAEHSLISVSAHADICDDVSLPHLMTELMTHYQHPHAVNTPESHTPEHHTPLMSVDVQPPTSLELSLGLTQQQQHIQRLEAEGSSTYRFNHKTRIQLVDVHNLPSLHMAFEQLCRRHPILGASLDASHKQLVCTNPPLFTIENVTHDDDPVDTCFSRHAEHAITLTDAALSSFKAYQVSEDTVFICITAHAMICDTESLHTIANDFKAFYTSHDSQSVITQFTEADYVALNNERYPNTLSIYREDISYWKEQLANTPSRITFAGTPTPPQRVHTSTPSHRRTTIDTALSNRISQFLNEHKLSSEAFFLASYHLLLSRHSGQDTIPVVIPAPNTPTDITPAYQSSNALVIKLTPGLNPRAEGYFTRADTALMHARKHNRVSFFDVLKHANLAKRDELAFHSAGFHFLCDEHASLNDPKHEFTHDIQRISRLQNDTSIYLRVSDTTDQYVIDFEYDARVFNDQDIQLMSGHYVQLMSNVIEDSQQPVNTISLHTSEELRSLLNCSSTQYGAILPLTNMQRDIYIDTTVNAQQTWNYFGQTNIFNCELDPARLQQAIDSVVEREPSLHSHIKPSHTHYSDIAYRCVLQDAPQVTLGMATHHGDHASLKRVANEFIHTPYSLDTELPLRSQLVRFNDTHWAWMIAFHHIVVDGLGMHIFIQTVLTTYEQLSNGESIEPLNYPFEDYATFNRLQCDTQETIAYWADAVTKAVPLSGGRHLASDPSGHGKEVHQIHTFSSEHSADIRKFCFAQRSTPAAYIKTILTIALNAYFKQNQQGLIFNEVRVGRTRQTIWTIGCCFTNQPFVVENGLLSNDATFKALLHFTSQYAQAVEPYGFISNSEQKKLVNSNETQVTFNFYGDVIPVNLFGSDCTTLEHIPNLDNAIHLVTRQANKQIGIDLLYNTSVWNDVQLLERMEHISQQVLSGENRLADLDLLFEDETPGVTPTVAPYRHSSMSQWLDNSATEYADNIAVTHLNRSYTHAQLHGLANQLAHHLISQGVSKHDKVALYLPSGFDFMVGLLGLVKANICYVPIDPNYPIERITYILNDANISRLITNEHLSSSLPIESKQCILLDESSSSFYIHAENYPATQPQVTDQLDDLFYTIYTSGSTGQPKATAVKIRGEINLLQWYCKEFEFSEQDAHLVISASGFDLTQKNFFAPLLSGGRLIFPDNAHHDIEHLQELIHTHQANVINCAPSAFYPLLETPSNSQSLDSLRLVLFGGESIRMSALIDWLDQDTVHAQIINMYGPTECTDIACFYRVLNPHQHLEHAIPIGRPNDNVRLYVVDSNMKRLPAGIPGELLIGGEGVGAGYLNRPEANDTVFINNPFAKGIVYRTGDLVKYNSDGELVFIGRLDKQLKLRGLRIEPMEIESVLARLNEIDSALVTVRNEQLIAYVRPHVNQALPADWKKSLAMQLPQYMVPHHAVTIDAWPLSPNGKIDTTKLPEPNIQTQYVPASTMTQSVLIDLWTELLDTDHIGIHHDFFELGGHSLTAAKLASRIRDQFEVELQLTDLFNSATIAELSRIIDQKQKDGQFIIPSITIADRSATLKLSHAQEQLWLVEQLHLGISAYNMPIALQLTGDIQLDSLEYALQTLCQRHEILRTQFLTDEHGQPYQFIQESIDSPLIEVTEHQGLSLDEQADHARQAAQHEIDTPFDLTRAPLVRIKLIQYSPENSLLLMTMHHIISDGWSLNIILHELFESYQAHIEQRPVELPTLRIQYADYSMWQRTWLEQSAQPQIDYWLNQLSDAPHILRLPTDYPRPAEQTFNGMLHRFTLDASLRSRLDAFSSTHNATLFMTLLLGYSILLSRFAQTRDVVIGSPNAGRTHVETENLIGFFVNPLILRLNTENRRLSDLIRHVKDTVLNALANQQVPAELIIEQLKIPRNPSYPPIAQVGFALQNLGNAHRDVIQHFDSLEVSQLNPNQCIAKYDLTLFFFEEDGELHGAFEYNSDLFTPETLDNLSDQLSNIYHALGDLENDQHIDQIELSTSEQLFKRLQLDPTRYESCHPLPATMQDFYLNALINPDTLSNNIGAGYFTEVQNFDLHPYQQRLNATVKKYAALRGQLIPADNMSSDSAYLAIRHHADIVINYYDISDKQWNDHDVIEYAHQECLTKYDLEHDELIRLYVLKISNTRYFNFLAANHILIDGMSGVLLMKHADNEVNTDSQEDNFLAYLQYSRARYDQPETIEFWKQSLRHHQTIHKHPTQESGLIQSTHAFDEVLTKTVKKYCFNQRITPQIFFKSMYGLLIAHYYRCEQDFIIRDTLNGRTPEFSDTIGCLAESPPFIFPQHKISGGDIDSITDLYAEILHLNELSKPHRAISLIKQASLMDTSGLQFVFNILQYMNHVNTDSIDSFHRFAQLQIENSVQLMVSIDQTIAFELRYDKKDFQEKQFFDRFEQLCQQILNNEQHILQYDFVLPHETSAVPSTVLNALSLDYPSLIHTFTRNAAIYGDKTALSYGNEHLSYRSLNEHSNRLAHHLAARGVRKHDLVCLYLDRSIEMIVSILAVMKLNATYVPLDPHSPDERVNYILDDSQSHALVSTSALLKDSSIQASDILIALDDDVDAIHAQPVADLTVLAVADDSICYIIYTSGTTGQPKGCLVSQINAARLFSTTQPVFQFNNQDVWTLYHSCAFDFSVWEIWGALYHAGELVIIPNDVARSPSAFYQVLRDKGVTVLNQTPSAFTQLIDEDHTHSTNELQLRYVIFGGEALNINALSRWVEKHPLSDTALINMYGITETTVHASYHVIDEDDLTQDASIIGYPLPDLHIQLVDQHKRPVAPGFLGEILISGAGVSHGYLRRPELTDERFITHQQLHCYASGDLAVHNQTGRLEYLGRIDQQVKIRGHRIELGEIESKLSKLSYVQEALVLAKEDQHGDKQLIAYTQCDHEVSSGQLRADLSEQLPEYMVPAFFVSIDEWPQTENGKVDLNALPHFDLDQDTYVAPRNKLEVQLAEIWQSVMGIDQIGVFDNFFEIGGHSLIAVRLAKRIQDELEIELPVAALFNAQDIASLATALSKGMVRHDCLVPLKAGHDAPIFFVHPINGLALSFAQLAQHMQTERPIIGIQAFGLNDDSAPSMRVEEAATRYIDAIKKAQPDGPYFIAGYSLGGVIALEIARQLINQGESIQWFTVIDAEVNFKWFSRRIKPSKLLYDFFKLMHPESPLKYAKFERVPASDQLDHLASHSNDTLSPEFLGRALTVLEGLKSMMDNYQAKPLHINGLYISAESRIKNSLMKTLMWTGLRKETLGWEKIITGQLTHISSPGDHESMMQAPYVEQLASLLDYSLDKADL